MTVSGLPVSDKGRMLHMNKKILTTMLLILMIASMLVLTTGCGAKDSEDLAKQVELLKAENAELKAQIAELTNQHPAVQAQTVLKSWKLDAQVWSDGNGATVTFKAEPVSYEEGQKAALSVRMGDLEAEGTNCNWDGTYYTGSVELSAADGYGYYCVLTAADGSTSEVELNSPHNVSDETLVYLGSSVSAYCNMVVEDWQADDSTLTIQSGYIQAQMPRLTAVGTAPTVSGAALVLKLNDQETERKDVTLSAGEGIGSFEAALSGVSFHMPVMEQDGQLDLWLEVTLSDGNVIKAAGGSWYGSDGQLQLAVG